MLNLLSRSPKALKKLKLVTYQQSNPVSQSTEKGGVGETVTVTSETPPDNSLKINQPSTFPSVSKAVQQLGKENGPRINPFGIQMLSATLFRQLFGTEFKTTYSERDTRYALENLKKYGLKVDSASVSPEVDLKLPNLDGRNIEEHFRNIGEKQSGPYRQLVQELTSPLPEMPSVWELQSGWTRYAPGKSPEKVNFPTEDAIVIDVEVCKSAGELPTLAVAASSEAWYGWVAPSLVEGSMPSILRQYNTQHLIPLESTASQRGVGLTKQNKVPRIAVGHNIMYDRARFKEQYWLERTGMRFVDTMSLHICVSGVTSYQKALLTKAKKNNSEEKETSDETEDMLLLQENSSLNSLGEVLKLYCRRSIDKSGRDLFIDGQLEEVRRHFQSSMSYCASDVKATHDVLQSLFPLFLERFPHPVTLAGMLEISMAYLPVNSNWLRYIESSEQTYQDLSEEARFQLARQADDACSLLHKEQYRKDLWMWDQDWSVSELRLAKRKPKPTKNAKEEREEKDEEESEHKTEESQEAPHVILDELVKRKEEFEAEVRVSPFIEELMKLESQLPMRPPVLPGYPAWYRKLCLKPNCDDWSPGPQLVTTKMQVTPKLLHLMWEKYPLHYIRGEGWGSLRPSDKDFMIKLKEVGDSGGLPLKELADQWDSIPQKDQLYGGNVKFCEGVMFSKLPHKNGPELRVGDPLGRDFLSKFAENVLSGDAVAEHIVSIAMKLSYWRNNKDRIMNQMVVWLSPRDLYQDMEEERIGVILPQLVISGTLTRRAVDRTWLTASNASQKRIGSELRAMVQAPPGYKIIGADVDSQELWIASLIGDAHSSRIHGGTPFGWMTLSGRKSHGTDMHSVTAKAVGISRDHAKVINYARIYGAGVPFAEQLLKQFNPSMTASDAKKKAKMMFEMTKGRRSYAPRKKYGDIVCQGVYTYQQAFEIARNYGYQKDDVFKQVWAGGTESAMFNRLEEIAHGDQPKTPFLSGRLSRALEAEKRQGLPTRINWVVQSGAVDFLHLLLVAFRWLEPDARFCLSFHDEVRYLVPENRAYQAALALHAAHLLTRVFCASRLGLVDLPLSVAFFTSVEVDQTLRKEAHDSCKTPSNPHGLESGYGIPLGECLDIYKAIEKAGGSNALIAPAKSLTKRKDVSGYETQACDAVSSR